MSIASLIKEDFLTVQKDQTLSQFIGKLKKTNQRDALVFDHEKFEGIIEDKWLLKSKLDATKTGISAFVKRIPTALSETTLIDAAYLMFQSDVGVLPVADNKKLLGVVSGMDLIKEASGAGVLGDFSVDSVKLVKTPRLNAKDPVSTALNIMFEKKVEQIPVMEGNKLAGVLSYRDILKRYRPFPVHRDRAFKGKGSTAKPKTRAFEPDRPEVDRLPVDSFDTHYNLQTVKEKDKLTSAVDLMHKKDLASLIVLQDEELLGLLTLKNILRKIASLKISQNFNIRFVDLEKTSLSPAQKNAIKKIASNEAFKLQRQLHNDFSLVIHVKEYKKTGKKDKHHKYAVNIRVICPSQIIQSHKGWGGTWYIETALRKAFHNAGNKLKSRFRGDSSHRKPYE